MSRNRVIGLDGRLPWVIPADLQRFRQLTMGHTVIMGRRTMESIGRPLAGRRNILVSSSLSCTPPGLEKAASLEEALDLTADDDAVFICGGGALYEQSLAVASRIYLTIVDILCQGDTFFPEIPACFTESARERISRTPPADLVTLVRRCPPASGDMP